MGGLIFNLISRELADAFREDPNKYLPEFRFREVRSYNVLWKSPVHLEADGGEFGRMAKDGNGSNILKDTETYPGYRYYVFDGATQQRMSFVEIYAAVHGMDYERALDVAFEIYGVDRRESPEAAARRKAQRELQTGLEKITAAAQSALVKVNGVDGVSDDDLARAQAYAKRRFSANEVAEAKIGYISESVLQMITDFIKKYEQTTGRNVRVDPEKIKRRICVPVVMFGNTYGYTCRKVERLAPEGETAPQDGKSKEPKYCDIVFYGSGGKPVYGLTRVPRTGVMKRPNVVIVEGEFACAKVRALTGLKNIVAIGSASVTDGQASMIWKAGYKSVTLFLDNDGFAKRGNNLKALESSVSTLHAAGLMVNAIRVEHDEDGKFAPDDEVKGENGGEYVRELINNAPPAVFTIIKLLAEIFNADEYKTADKSRTFIDECIRAIASYSFDEIEKANAIKSFVDAIGANYGVSVMSVRASIAKIKDSVSEEKDKAEEASRIDEATRLYQEAADAMTVGDYGGAKKMTMFANTLLDKKGHSDLVRLLPPQDPADIFNDTQVGPPILMPFYFTPNGRVPKDKYERDAYRYAITSGGVDLISALTSHGKTRMLENVALNCIYEFGKRGQERQVLFFTAEEVRPSIMCHFASIEAGARMINRGARLGDYITSPLTGIQQIYASGKYDCVHECIRNTGVSRTDAINIVGDAIRSVNGFIKGGHLSIFRENKIRAIEEIVLASEVRMQTQIGAVFVDYAQIIHSDSKFAQDPKAVVTDVMNRLLSLAQNTGAAIVVGSQLNRGRYTPLTMDCQNNSLASDLEQIAFSDALMWNSSGGLREGAVWDTKDPDVVELERLGFRIGDKGRLYVRLGKNRRGDRNVWGVLDIDGSSGYISGNTKLSFDV